MDGPLVLSLLKIFVTLQYSFFTGTDRFDFLCYVAIVRLHRLDET